MFQVQIFAPVRFRTFIGQFFHLDKFPLAIPDTQENALHQTPGIRTQNIRPASIFPAL
jgi:hypothetical protein